MPAVLIEAGFINSDIDNRLWDTKFSETAEAIARGIDMTIRDAGLAAAEDGGDTDSEYDDSGLGGKMYQILTGIFRTYNSAAYQLNTLVNFGYDGEIFEEDGLYQVRVGGYGDIEEALIAQRELRNRGYDTLIVNAVIR
jgi:N-acetylmuramoyl-L-alanine amidase